MTKNCPKCGHVRPLTNFYKNSRTKDGLTCWCKDCNRVASALSAKKNPVKARERSKAWRDANPERARAARKALFDSDPARFAKYSADHRARNPEAQAIADAKCYAKNREARLARDKAKREANIEDYRRRERESYERTKEKRAVRMKAWAQANKAKVNFYAADRRAAVVKRTPKWLCSLDKELMECQYWYADFLSESTGIPHHVDHIVPLRGKLVSGLNVPWNLEVIPAVANMKKGNRHAT